MVGATEAEQAKSEEKFKRILQAYETLSNPISRQAYDLENSINQGVNLDQSTYEDSATKQNYFQPKTQKDFYYTKWTGYQAPENYNPFDGSNIRDEYIYRRPKSEREWAMSGRFDFIFKRLEETNRLFIWLGLYAVS